MSLIQEAEYLLPQKVGLDDSNFLFTNITPLIELINRKQEQIENSDLAYFMEKSLDPQKAIDLVEKLQKEEVQRMKMDPSKSELLTQNVTPTYYIFRTLLLKKFLYIGFLNFTDKAVQIGSIFFLDLVTDSIKEYNKNNDSDIVLPILYLSSMTVVYIFGTYLDAIMNNVQNQFSTLLKIIGQYLIYQKALRTKYLQETVQKSNNEKKDGDEEHVANVNNLLTVDVEELQGIMWGVFEFSSSIVMIVVVIYMLWIQLGNAMYYGLIFFVVAIIINAIVTSLTIYFYRKALIHKDDRMGLTTDIIDGMKQIKYLSWEETFNSKILELRKKEFLMISCQKSVDTLNNVYWSSISYILLYIFLSTYISYNTSDINQNPLQNTNVFTIIALFNLLTFPMGVLPYCINQLINTRVSYGRIKTFLNIEEMNPLEVERVSDFDENMNVIEIQKTEFRWPVKKQQEDKNKYMSKIEIEDPQIYIFQLNVKDLYIKHNSINMIIGRIGSGKTALLNAILNEMDNIQKYKENQSSAIQLGTFIEGEDINNRVRIKGSIAYVSQNHWLQNMSIRENILFGKPFDRDFYLKCVSACQLVHDISTFPNKDLFVLGPDAKNISGGQKQRISLCRAIYQDCDIYLMDDIFSSLDMHVADHVFIQVIKELLLDRGKTILMVTSQFRFIDMHNKSNIIYIDNGAICRDADKLAQFMSSEREKQKKEDLKEDIQEDIQDNLILQKQESQNPESILQPGDKGIEDEEERQQGEIALNTVYYYMSQMSWPIVCAFLIFTIAIIFSRNLVDFWLRAQITPGDTSFDFLKGWFGESFDSIFASLIAINFAITVLGAGSLTLCTLLSGWRIFKKLNQSVMNSKMEFFDKNAQGRIINRLSSDTLCVDDELPWYAGIFVNSLLSCIGYPMGIIILFPWMLVIIIFEVYFFWVLQKIFRKSNRDLKRIQSTNEGKVISHLTETTSGLRVVRAFEKQVYFTEEYIRKLTEAICSFINSRKVSYWLGVRLHILSNAIFISVALTIIIFMIAGYQIDYSTCAMTLTYAVLIANSFNETMNWFTQTEAKLVSVERIRQYHNNKQESLEAPVSLDKESKLIIHKLVPPKPERVTAEEIALNAIIFNDVTITYDNVLESQNVKFALKNFTLKIKKGEKIAFVGRTGSGKTSILNILFRLYDFQQGQIYVNGKNIQTMNLKDVRMSMSIVPQFGFLYNATLRENIDPQHLLTDQEIENSFNQTGFKIRGIMEENNNNNNNNENQNTTNIQFMIAKSGSNLSNGERQVINFMRIMLQNKDIVCLDEATSNMDPKTDEELHKTLFEYVQNRTLLVITHRLENIKFYDRIVVLEQGQIMETGSYEELMQKEDGLFVKLVKQQLK